MSTKKALDEKVLSGEVEIGVNVVQREYQNIKMNTSGEVVRFNVHGRKHLLSQLREKLFKKHQKFMRLKSDDYFEKIEKEELIKRLTYLGEIDHF